MRKRFVILTMICLFFVGFGMAENGIDGMDSIDGCMGVAPVLTQPSVKSGVVIFNQMSLAALKMKIPLKRHFVIKTVKRGKMPPVMVGQATGYFDLITKNIGSTFSYSWAYIKEIPDVPAPAYTILRY